MYPNSSQNMINQLVAGVGYFDQSSLPEWMTSNQPGATAGTFNTPLGFTKAVVLAYTKPGASKLMAYRLRNSGINFNKIDFTVDRYLLDDYYTTNFNTATNRYFTNREATFDTMPVQNIGTLVATVNYGVTVPFNQISGRPIDYIIANGGIDGVMDFRDGETIIFIQQENFGTLGIDAGPYDGWASYTDAYIGDSTLTTTIEGYDSEGFDKYSVIPGYLEKLQQSIPSYTITANAVSRIPSSNTSIGYNQITVSTTTGLSAGMDVVFNTIPSTIVRPGKIVQTLGNITIGGTYTINSVIDGDRINVTNINNFELTTNSGTTINGFVYSNQRGGVWQINIIGGIVTLSFVQEVQINQRVRILNGKTYSGAIFYYSIDLHPGQNVPYYTLYRYTPVLNRKRTTFNGDSTRFFNFRDQYYTPGSQDKYVKFPQYGVFN